MNRDKVLNDTVAMAIDRARTVIPNLPSVAKALSAEGQVDQKVLEERIERASKVIHDLGPLYLKSVLLSAENHYPSQRVDIEAVKLAHKDVEPLPPHYNEVYEQLSTNEMPELESLLRRGGRTGFRITGDGSRALEALLVAKVIDTVGDVKDEDEPMEAYEERVGGTYNSAISKLEEVRHVSSWWDALE